VSSLRRLALEVFGRLPVPLRRLAVRILTPRFVLGAVVALRHGDDVLMLQSRHVRFGWTLPGGLVQGGENPKEALERELVEELRLEVELDPEAALVVVDTQARRVDFVFERRVDVRPRLEVDGTEVLDAQWLSVTTSRCDDATRDVLARLAPR
jgi:ADP-ribose pyrophosphatase YjhB (NUDIX family)